MIMRAKQEGAVLVFELEGHLDFETTQQFQSTCASLLEKNGNQRVIFNLEKLKFVGSSGINQFIRVLKEFNSREERPKICKLSTEFDKIFRAYQTTRNPFEIFLDEPTAIAAFDLPRPPKKIRAAKPATAAQKKTRGN
jgi:anti-anti-sigma factor